jgi:hypothetical protein
LIRRNAVLPPSVERGFVNAVKTVCRQAVRAGSAPVRAPVDNPKIRQVGALARHYAQDSLRRGIFARARVAAAGTVGAGD